MEIKEIRVEEDKFGETMDFLYKTGKRPVSVTFNDGVYTIKYQERGK